ncbi:MAG: S-methyl-5-thioribose-1-phosphate isomerase [Candidatus Omnitrophica bacterium]|nr:S-methyl-5-thioribose-1-phosphate isomerase [Candidatus Omnitrophota bacterium]
MNIRTLEFKNNKVRIIDQTKLPHKLEYINIDNAKDMWQAIKELKVRGAPALGAAAALGVYLGISKSKAKTFREFSHELDRTAKYLAASRPTARNLFWGIERACSIAVKNSGKSVAEIKKWILNEAFAIIEEDRRACRNIGRFGAKLIGIDETILTVCNAGILATIDYGTALGVIYRAKAEGKRPKVFSCETRPLLQGARLTTWELMKEGVDVTLISDNMAAHLMKERKIDKVVVGADRIAANGDSANKIGTLGLAVISAYHKIPFYIAAPCSTIDQGTHSGKEITIEERDGKEITDLFTDDIRILRGIEVYNPAFDVTPHELIAAIITDRGVVCPPYKENIRKLCV